MHFCHILVIPLWYLVSVFGQMSGRIRNNSVIHSEGCQLFLKVATFKRMKRTFMGNGSVPGVCRANSIDRHFTGGEKNREMGKTK